MSYVLLKKCMHIIRPPMFMNKLPLLMNRPPVNEKTPLCWWTYPHLLMTGILKIWYTANYIRVLYGKCYGNCKTTLQKVLAQPVLRCEHAKITTLHCDAHAKINYFCSLPLGRLVGAGIGMDSSRFRDDAAKSRASRLRVRERLRPPVETWLRWDSRLPRGAEAQ